MFGYDKVLAASIIAVGSQAESSVRLWPTLHASENRLILRAVPMLSLYNFTLPKPLPNLRLVQFTLSDIKYDVIITTRVFASLLIN